MKLSLALAAVLIVPFARSAGAQDASSAAIAAAAAAAVPAAAPQTDVPKKEETKPRKKAAKGKKQPSGETKYRTRALSENNESHYRFDENSNPIVKKKPAPKLKKKSSPEDSEDKPSCSAEQPCSDKKSSDADAL